VNELMDLNEFLNLDVDMELHLLVLLNMENMDDDDDTCPYVDACRKTVLV